MTQRQTISFSIRIDGQPMQVDYHPIYFSIGYDHFEFRSPYEPPRRIPVSETGYRSHFSPSHEVQAAPSVAAYAEALAIAIQRASARHEQDDEEQADLFG